MANMFWTIGVKLYCSPGTQRESIHYSYPSFWQSHVLVINMWTYWNQTWMKPCLMGLLLLLLLLIIIIILLLVLFVCLMVFNTTFNNFFPFNIGLYDNFHYLYPCTCFSCLLAVSLYLFIHVYYQYPCTCLYIVESSNPVNVLDTTLCDTVCQWLATGRWFSPSPPVSVTI